MQRSDFMVKDVSNFSLKSIKTGSTGKLASRAEGEALLEENIRIMTTLQPRLYAGQQYSLLIIFQAMDTAGKDSAIKHVMSGLNPQGTNVFSFKAPSRDELDHDYLWRANVNLPRRGHIGIFNRSYYEDVLVVRVHNLIEKQNFPKALVKDIWNERFRQIRDYERYLSENCIVPIKFFLHISRDEQSKRLLARIDDPDKNWKFAASDIEERAHWDAYQQCYEETIVATHTKYAPWYIIPADHKWYARAAIAYVIMKTLKDLNPDYPTVDDAQRQVLEECKQRLLSE